MLTPTDIKSIQATGRSVAALRGKLFWPAPDFWRSATKKSISDNVLTGSNNENMPSKNQKL
jgi:hypothetical protein